MKIFCVKKCFYEGRLYLPGESLEIIGETVPKHFSSNAKKTSPLQTAEDIKEEKERALRAVGHGRKATKKAAEVKTEEPEDFLGC